METRFLVARNPDSGSTLPYLLWIPIRPSGLVLRAREPWPRTSKVYCYRANDQWPAEPDVVSAADVKVCQRRGVAIDLILDRRQENRSQFVFARLKGGREAIFWQSARTAKEARPGVRIPGRRASWLAEFEIVVDSREHYPYRFAKQQALTRKAPLPIGDYGVFAADAPVALVERKSLQDLASGLSDGSLQFQMAELSAFPWAAVVVEERYSAVFKHAYVAGGVLADMLARIQVRYPSVPIVFCETRPLAEEWTFRFLGAALAVMSTNQSTPPPPGFGSISGPILKSTG